MSRIKNQGFFCSIRPKITIGTLCILLICMLFLGSLFLSREHNRLTSEMKEQGHLLVSLVAQFCASPIEKSNYSLVQEVVNNIAQSQGVVFCEVYNTQGVSLVEADTTVAGQKIAKKPRVTGKDIIIVEAPINKGSTNLGRVEIGLELSPISQKIKTHAMELVSLTLIILILVAIALNTYLSHNFISPVVNLSEAAKNLAKGEFVETVVAKRSDEIGELARTFNKMSTNLKHHYHSLEREVNERTADLERTNTKLQQEIQVRQQTEIALKSAKEIAEKANQYKSNFVANMSHEIRTPLNAILGYAQILQSKNGLDDHDKKALEAIDRSGSHLLELLNDILDLAKIEAGRIELSPSSFDLCLLLRNMGSMFQLRCMEKNLSWQIVGIDTNSIIPVIGDAGRIRQILINLLGNAVKFTDMGGVVLRVTVNAEDMYQFCIEDTGIGVPEADRLTIFTPFSDVSGKSGKEGTGLGLSISTSFLKMMGSRLEILDNTPRGSRFCFEVQLPPARNSSLPKKSPPQKIVGLSSDRTLSALIVDDDALSRAMLMHLLNKTGIKTSEAENGLEALKVLQTDLPDIIFMDRYMPELDGPETIRAISTQFGANAPPIIMITAATFASENDPYDKMDVSGVILKPCDIGQVLQCMASVLELSLEIEDSGQENKGAEGLPLTPDDMYIPEPLRKSLMTAAEFGRISELKALAVELGSSHTTSKPLAVAILNHIESYQLESILHLLKKANQKT